MSRRDRKAAAEERRKEWRRRWVELAQSRHMSGTAFKDCLRLIELDASHLARQSPPLKSEIVRAMEELNTNLSAAILIVQQQREEAGHGS